MKHALAMAAMAAVLILGMGLLSGWWIGPSEGGGGSQQNGSAGFTVKQTADDRRVLLEAEAAQEVALPVRVVSAGEGAPEGASGGKCCYIGPEKWNEDWKSGKVEGAFEKGHEKARNPGFARYSFQAPETGEYVLWLRAWWVDDCGNSVDVSVDGAAPAGLTGSTIGRWVWLPLRNVESAAVRISLEKGRAHTLTICNREDDVYFDQILLQAADVPVDPVGIQK